MREVKIQYTAVSQRRQEWRDRLQLLGASNRLALLLDTPKLFIFTPALQSFYQYWDLLSHF